MTSEEYDNLTEEKQNINVAELCGWQGPYRGGSTHLHGFPKGVVVPDDAAEDNCTRHWLKQDHVPDYINDLNAMHKAEKLISAWDDEGDIVGDVLWMDYRKHLDETCNKSPVIATASQRAKAFVLTMTEGE